MSAPPPPVTVDELFGARADLAVRYAELLADAGVVRGLIGPREVPTLWDRHVLNCAVLSDVVPAGARVTDVGSGAGLPGLVVAIRRPDVRVDLVEPLARRCAFLTEAIDELGLSDAVHVHRGRAEERTIVRQVGGADIVTARAVAPLSRLVRWCLPLVRPGGSLWALKGARAENEVDEARDVVRSSGGILVGIESLGSDPAVARAVRIDRAR